MIVPPLLRLSPRAVFLLALLASAWLWGRSCGADSVPRPTTPIAVAETVHVAAKARADTVREEVVKWTTRWRTDTAYRSDTVTVRDTLRILVPLAQFDSTIRACSELSTACERERAAAGRLERTLRDSLARAKDHRWGCTAGPGATATRDGEFAYGLGITCGRRVFP